jgi:YegS/Rv2252/BmrU family lipid kinase
MGIVESQPANEIAAMKALLIVNPTSGHGPSGGGVASLQQDLREFVAETVETQNRGEAEELARSAAARGFDAVLVAGGDGTVNEAVNGLVTDGSAALPLGIIPVGTQNVLAHELGIRSAYTESIVELLRAGRSRRIDLGRAGGRCFSLMAGFGFDASVVRDVEPTVKDLIGPAAYALAALHMLLKYKSTSVKLRLDGQDVTTEAFLVVIANAASYAWHQVHLAPFASLDDGWLDVCVFERAPLPRVGFVTQLAAVLTRRHLKDPRVRYYRARRIEVSSDPPVQGQLDGDTYSETPLTVEVLPKALTVLVP